MATTYNIEVTDNNLYATGYLNIYDGTDQVELLRIPLDLSVQEGDEFFTIGYGERLDRIAWKFYKKNVQDASKLWWIIADANKIYNPLDLTEWIGRTIFIPEYNRVRLILDQNG